MTQKVQNRERPRDCEGGKTSRVPGERRGSFFDLLSRIESVLPKLTDEPGK